MPEFLCIYHDKCIDGFTAAWVVRGVHQRHGIDMFAANYGDPPPDVAGKRVIVVDFSYPRETLLAMYAAAESVVVLDHHKTAQADLAGLDFAVFDMERSGAGLAWDAFVDAGLDFAVFDMERSGAGLAWDAFVDVGQGPFEPPAAPPAAPRAPLVDYVQDRDLWRFRLPDSKTVNAAIHCWPRDSFESWDALARLSVEELKTIGRGAEMQIENYIREMRSLARIVPIFSGILDVTTINCPFVNCSELVGALAESDKNGIAVGWWRRSDGKYQYSLRSRGEIDVSEIAAAYGGGGHARAAGFTTDELLRQLR